jgi:hypothetical protein
MGQDGSNGGVLTSRLKKYIFMRRFVFCYFAWLLCLGAEERWTKVETANFTLYTRDSEKQARKAAQQFEEAHLFFESLWRKLDKDPYFQF